MRIFIISTIFLVALSIAVAFTPSLREYAISLSFQIKEFYIDKSENLNNFVQDYINQSQKIKDMREEILTLEESNMRLQSIHAELENLYYATGIERHYEDPDVSLARVLSYASLGSYTRIWITYDKEVDSKKIFGIIKDGYAIGIAKVVNNHLLGILNGDTECSYSVFIGNNRVPGTVRSMPDGSIVVDYIPAWQSINSGDVVVTSGLDGIFFEEIEVGTIGAIRTEESYLQAELKPHVFNNRLRYVWLVDTKIPQTTRIDQNEKIQSVE